MLAEMTFEELAAGLDTVAGEVLAEAGTDRPPVDAFAVAAALGVCLGRDDRQQGRARYVRYCDCRSGGQAAILFRSDPRAEREQWAVAHEIGEHVAKRAFARLGIDPSVAAPNAREQMASHLAGRLLVSSAWLAAAGPGCGWDLFALKACFATASHELIARRMLECRPTVIVSIFDQGRLWFRRTNLAGRVPPLTPRERECWAAAHQSGAPQHADARHFPAACWPIHENGWKREILRTEWDGQDEFLDE